MTRTEALNKIDDIRDGLYDCEADYNNPALVSIVRDLWDEYPIADAQSAARNLHLRNYDAQTQIKTIVAAITE